MNTKRQINPIKNTSFRLFADIVSDETRIETEKYGSYNGRKNKMLRNITSVCRKLANMSEKVHKDVISPLNPK